MVLRVVLSGSFGSERAVIEIRASFLGSDPFASSGLYFKVDFFFNIYFGVAVCELCAVGSYVIRSVAIFFFKFSFRNWIVVHGLRRMLLLNGDDMWDALMNSPGENINPVEGTCETVTPCHREVVSFFTYSFLDGCVDSYL